MWLTLKTYLQLFIFKGTPLTLPRSAWLSASLIFVYLLMHFPELELRLVYSWAFVLFNLVWLLFFVAITLKARNIKNHTTQVYNAALGVLILQTLVVVVCSYLLVLLDPLDLNRITNIVSIAMLIWSWPILTNIMHHALRLNWLYAGLVVLAFEVLRLLIVYQIYYLSVY